MYTVFYADRTFSRAVTIVTILPDGATPTEVHHREAAETITAQTLAGVTVIALTFFLHHVTILHPPGADVVCAGLCYEQVLSHVIADVSPATCHPIQRQLSC